MSLYIDPKDKPSHPDWPCAYSMAWEERRRLRLEQFKATKRIEQLESFMLIYEQYDGPVKPTPITAQVTTSSVAGVTAVNGTER